MSRPPRAQPLEVRGRWRLALSGDFLCFWLLGALLVLGRYDSWLFESVGVIPPPVRCSLAPAWAWSVPAGTLLNHGHGLALPVWLYSLLAGGVMAVLIGELTAAAGLPIGLLGLLGWSLAMRPDDLLSGALLVCGGMLVPRNPSAPLAIILSCIVWMLVCACCTLEFGLLWVFCGFVNSPALANPASRKTSLLIGAIIAGAAVLAVTAYFHQGFPPALLRPLSWLWRPYAVRLIPSLGFALTTPGAWPAHWLLAIALFALWISAMTRPSGSRIHPLALLAFSALGLGCGHDLWLSTAALALLSSRIRPGTRHAHGSPAFPLSPRHVPSEKTIVRRGEGGRDSEPFLHTRPAHSVLHNRVGRLLLAVAGVLAFARLAASLPGIGLELAGAAPPPDRVDPSRWPAAGPALLMNLERSRDWEQSSINAHCPLLLDDRWDLFGPYYADYFALCRDIGEFRDDAFLRPDGTWGGSKLPLQNYQPALLVVDTDQLDDLHRLSLDPHWQPLGLDGARTIFARSDAAPLRSALQQAISMLTRLEFPGLSGAPLAENVVVVRSPEEYRRAALALAALRRPTAALRVLRAAPGVPDPAVEALCFLDLAERALRYAGTPSLLDQGRAACRLRELCQSASMDPDVALRLATGAASIGLGHLARELAPSAQRRFFWTRTASVDPQRRAALEILLNREPPPPAWSPPDLLESEALVRAALLRGDLAACETHLPGLPAALRPYYAALVAAPTRSVSEAERQLQAALAQHPLPPRLQGEAWFYLGCLANEAGDPPTAAQAFARSAAAAPDSPWAPLRTLFLKTITGT